MISGLSLLLTDHARLDAMVVERQGIGPLSFSRFPASGLRLNRAEEVRLTIQGQPTIGGLCTFHPKSFVGILFRVLIGISSRRCGIHHININRRQMIYTPVSNDNRHVLWLSSDLHFCRASLRDKPARNPGTLGILKGQQPCYGLLHKNIYLGTLCPYIVTTLSYQPHGWARSGYCRIELEIQHPRPCCGHLRFTNFSKPASTKISLSTNNVQPCTLRTGCFHAV